MNIQHHPAAPALTAAHYLLEGLVEVGIEYMFVNLGTDHAPIIEEMARWKEAGRQAPAFVICPHESTAAHMAGGYALGTGRGQVALVHVDAGTANAVMGMHNMFRSRLPLMLMAGKAPYTSHGELVGTRDNYVHFIQEPNDQGSLVRPYSKWEYTLQSAVTAKEVVRRAHTIMQSGAKGPVYLMLPRETLAETAQAAETRSFPDHKHGAVQPGGADPELVERLARKLLAARHPILITSYGGQTEGVSEAIERLSRLVGIRVFESNMVTNISHEMECFCGYAPGKHLARADVGIIVDSDVPWIPSQAKQNPDTYWGHIDVDVLKPSSPIWSFPADLRIQGNSAAVLDQLIEFLEREASADLATAAALRMEEIRAEHQVLKANARKAAENKGEEGAINSHYFFSEFGRMLEPDDMILHEAVRNQPAMVAQIPRSLAKTMVRTGGGGLGASGGMALGTKLADKGRTVIQIVGDGSFYYNNPASVYAVSKQYDLPILTIILDNGGWSAVKESTLRVYPEGYAKKSNDFSSELAKGVDFASMADMFGFKGLRLSVPGKVAETVREALDSVRAGMTTILHVQVTGH